MASAVRPQSRGPRPSAPISDGPNSPFAPRLSAPKFAATITALMSSLTDIEKPCAAGAVALSVATAKPSLLADLLILAKFRLTAMVVITTAVGFILARPHRIAWLSLLATTFGTWGLAGAAAALNQYLEIAADGRMFRTQNRPLPAHRMRPWTALLFAVLLTLAGLGLLCGAVNTLTALLGLANVALYALVYTPLKRLSSMNTLVGAVCGAIPPVLGFTAVENTVTAPALALAGVLFIWQIPHFLALAWWYRDDYARAGFRMLSVTDIRGRFTGGVVVLYSLLLIPVSLLAGLVTRASGWYDAAAVILAGAMVWAACGLARHRSRQAARRAFLTSVIYLPLLLLMLVAAQGLKS